MKKNTIASSIDVRALCASFVAIFAAVALVYAFPAYAQSADAEGSAGAGASGSAGGAQVGLEVSAETRAQAGTGGDEGETNEAKETDKATPKLMEASVKGTQDGDPDRPMVEGQIFQNNQSDIDFLQGNVVSVSAVEVRGWDPKQKQEFLATVKAHAQVQSGQDLENFATGILLKDENVEEISSDEDSVEVRYRVPAKFLGIFETSIPVIVVAEKAQGELGGGVKVRFPWYRVLFGIEEEVSETSLETDIGAEVIADLDSDGALDVSVAARIYTAISNVLKTKHDTVKNSVGNIR
ncbi:hypothetical protein C4556_02710 [Candidatus Parcubacteria bacterium]|nr:MAG: hypothetical protein C4556_02710 [Candidatus Parcubacteria bacterium]